MSLFDIEEPAGTEGVTDEAAAAEEVKTEEVESESEESESEEVETEEVETEEVETEESVYEIDGEEVTAEDLRAWKEAFSNKGDREGFEVKSKELSEKSSKLDEHIAAFEGGENEIQEMLLADLESDDELKELKSSDYTEYLQAKDRRDEKIKSFNDVKKRLSDIRQERLSSESAAISELRGWSMESKRNDDLALLNDFAKDQGFTDADMRTLTSAKVLAALISTAEQAKKVGAKSKARKKVIKPTVVKAGGKGTKTPEPKSLADKLFSDN